MTIEETPKHREGKALTAIDDQFVLDFDQGDVRLAADQPQQIVAVRLDPIRAAVASARSR